MAHLRYPEDLFKVQRKCSRVPRHRPGAFYGGRTSGRCRTTRPTDAAAGAQPPYYLTLKMPDQEQPAFSLTSTFIPDRLAVRATC